MPDLHSTQRYLQQKSNSDSLSISSTRFPILVLAIAYTLFVIYGSLVPLNFQHHSWQEAVETFKNIRYLNLGIGSRADWVRNIEANPRFQAQVGRRKFQARLSALSSENAGELMVKFYRAKPAYTRSVMAMVGMKFEGEEELRKIASQLKLFAVKPELSSPPISTKPRK